MSRTFNGSSDTITFGAGAAPSDQGPITVVALVKLANTSGFTGWLARGRKGGSGVWALLTSNNAGPKLFMENDFGNGVSGLTTDWMYYVATKPAGAHVPRFHVKNVTSGAAFTHTDGTGFNVGDGSGPIDDILIGQSLPGSYAVAAAVAAEWSDAEVEANCTLAAADLLTALGGSGWMARFNQTDTATTVADDTGNGGDQTDISGTTIGTDDPPGYDYSLAGPAAPAEGSVAAGLSMALAVAGHRSSAGRAGVIFDLAPSASGGRPSAGAAGLSLRLSPTARGMVTVGAGAGPRLDSISTPVLLASIGPAAGRIVSATRPERET